MRPTVSICIPTYNGAKYLSECLDSVLMQTFSDYEVLLVDDCSSDATLDIARRYALRDSRIRISLNEKRLGLVKNWNRCVQVAGGEWIKFVFQDDLIAPECVARMLDAARARNTLFVCCARDFLFGPDVSEDDRGFFLKNKADIEAFYRDVGVRSPREVSEEALARIGRNLAGEPTTVLLHRSVFGRVGVFNEHLVQVSDGEYWVRVGSHTGIAHVPETLATFRVHTNSTSTANFRSRRYRMSVLDPLLVLHEFAFDPVYEALRAAARDRRPPVDLVDLFWRRALNAESIAKQRARSSQGADRSLLEEWQLAAAAFPRLTSAPRLVRLKAKWHAVRRVVGAWDVGRLDD